MKFSKPLKETILVSVPIILSHFIEILIPFLNTYLAAQISNEALAASAITTTTFVSFMGFSWGVTAAVGIITANQIGAKNLKNIGINLKSGYIVSLILSGVIMLILYNFDLVWAYIGQDKELSALAYIYLSGWILAVIPDSLKYVAFQYCISFNRTKIPIIAHIISIPIIFFLNDALIWGKYGLPELGIFGLGLGTAIVYWIVFIGMYTYMYFDPDLGRELQIKHKLSDYKKKILSLFKIGLPIGVMFTVEIVFFMAIALMIGLISKEALAAYQINNQWLFMFIIISYAFAETVIILVSKAHGANDMELAKKYHSLCSILSVSIVSLSALAFCFVPEIFIAFDLDIKDSNNIVVIDYAKAFFILTAIGLVIDSKRIVVAGTLRGLTFAKFPMWMAIISFWIIGVPVCYILAFTFDMGPIGLLYGEVVAIAINAILLYFKIKRVFSGNNFISSDSFIKGVN